MCWLQNSIRSPIRRRCGSGANSHSFCAMYSLKMSVCRVPSRSVMSLPWRSAATRYMQKTGTAGPLIVIDVVVWSSGMPSKSSSMSCAESIATPQWPTSPFDRGSSESRPISVGMSNATDRPVSPALEQHLVPLVGLPDVAEPGELPDRPRLAPVAAGVQAPREGELPRPADAVRRLRRRWRAVDGLDVEAGQGGEVGVAFRALLVPALPAFAAALAALQFSRTSYDLPVKSSSPPGRSSARARRLWRRRGLPLDAYRPGKSHDRWRHRQTAEQGRREDFSNHARAGGVYRSSPGQRSCRGPAKVW